MDNMKVLIFGAGVLGSLYAARLQEAGTEVALVARGQRYRELEEHGVVLEEFKTGQRTTTAVRVLDQMPADEYFDVCLVLVQKTQVESALEALATNELIPAFVFMHNTAQGPQPLVEALGEDRVLMGHANAGGERDGHVVRYMIAEKMPLGELDGSQSERLQVYSCMLEEAGFPVEISRNIDAWKRYHVALAVPFAYAMYQHQSCNLALSRDRQSVRQCLRGIGEGFRALRQLGYPVEPPRLRWLLTLPDFLLAPLFQRVLRMPIADIGMARHLRNAQEEMEQLSREFRELVDESGLATPALDELQGRAPAVAV